MSVRIIRGDALALPIADETVDLVVTSPPYYGLRSYQDGGEHYAGQIGDELTPADYVDSLVRATAEMVRVLKPTGSIWINLGDKYASPGGHTDNGASSRLQGRKAVRLHGRRPNRARNGGARKKSLLALPWRYAIRCLDDLDLILRAEVIWHKPNGLPESVTDRVKRSHETWLHFTKEPRYYADMDVIRTEHATQRTIPRDGGPAAPWSRDGKVGGVAILARHNTGNPNGALPGSVWDIPTQPLTAPEHLGIDHYAAFPMEWPRRIVKAWCPPGGVVLDPFGGTGTTALVADLLGRHGISIDYSADYCRLAEWRVSDPRQRALAAQRDYTPPPQQVMGQAAFTF